MVSCTAHTQRLPSHRLKNLQHKYDLSIFGSMLILDGIIANLGLTVCQKYPHNKTAYAIGKTMRLSGAITIVAAPVWLNMPYKKRRTLQPLTLYIRSHSALITFVTNNYYH